MSWFVLKRPISRLKKWRVIGGSQVRCQSSLEIRQIHRYFSIIEMFEKRTLLKTFPSVSLLQLDEFKSIDSALIDGEWKRAGEIASGRVSSGASHQLNRRKRWKPRPNRIKSNKNFVSESVIGALAVEYYNNSDGKCPISSRSESQRMGLWGWRHAVARQRSAN